MGKIKFPRLESDAKIKEFPDTFNSIIEEVATGINQSQAKIEESNKKIDDMNSKLEGFYGKLIEIFGIFIAIFSFIIIFINQNLNLSKGKDIWETAWNSLGYLLPLTIVLLIFVLLLNHLKKK